MTSRSSRTAWVITCISACAVGTLAQATLADCVGFDKTFTGAADATWQNGDNRSPPTAPTSLTTVCIPVDRTAIVVAGTSPDAQAKSLRIDGEPGDPLTGGTVIVSKDATLTLYQNSVVNGSLKLQRLAKLYVDTTGQSGPLIITSDGGEIEGDTEHDFPDQQAIILNPAGVNKPLRISGVGSEREDSLVVHGGLDIRLNLNNTAYVIADKKLNPLLLSTTAKKVGVGGHWIAERDPGPQGGAGYLKVNAAISGGGDWISVDHAGCIIEFNATCQGLSGDFAIEQGRLFVNQSILTTGNLTVRSVETGTPPAPPEASEPSISVADGKSAIFLSQQ